MDSIARGEEEKSNSPIQNQQRKNRPSSRPPVSINNIKVIYTNTDNSLLCKIDELKGILSTDDYAIAAACEIKPKYGTIPSQELLEIEGYDCFLNPAYTDPDTRGVIIYVKQYLNAQLVTCRESDDFKDSVWVRIPTANQSVLVGCVYRSGTAEKAKRLDDELFKMMRYMCLQSGHKSTLIPYNPPPPQIEGAFWILR